MSPSEMLRQYAFLHNRGVETNDFGPLLSQFAPDAIFDFQYPAIGTFKGSAAIREIFCRRPPDFLLGIGKITETLQAASADYHDQKNPSARLGSIRLKTNGEKITGIYICK